MNNSKTNTKKQTGAVIQKWFALFQENVNFPKWDKKLDFKFEGNHLFIKQKDDSPTFHHLNIVAMVEPFAVCLNCYMTVENGCPVLVIFE